MKWLKICGALLAAMSMNSLADAGLLGALRGDCGGAKGCGCAATCQPQCCKPVIVKPCCPNVYTYQRKCSDIKPPCCDTCCPPATCCAPAACAPAACAAPAANCAPAATTCAPAACAPVCAAPAATTCAPAPAACAPACAAPAACAPAPAACAPACAAPAACAPACAAPVACTPACAPVCRAPKKGLLSGLFSKTRKNDCAAPTACTPACEVRCCNADPCEVATLIYESQTACKAKHRERAIHKLGDKFDCICNPEIMTAFIVGLNDCDEDVRKKAADEIGDQIRKNCCCSPEVVAALTCALGDCDKGVVKQATEALELCGYEVVDGNCNTCGTTAACGTGACGTTGGYAPAPAPMGVAPAPAPVPPQDGQARKGGLSQLLGLLD